MDVFASEVDDKLVLIIKGMPEEKLQHDGSVGMQKNKIRIDEKQVHAQTTEEVHII